MRARYSVVLLLLVCAVASEARDKHLPLPPQILTAKTIYIDNQSGMAKLGDRAYEQLEKWGKYKVVQDKKSADLILLLSAREYHRGYVSSGSQTTGHIDESGNINTTTSPTYSSEVTVGYTYITMIDPASGDALWSDSKRWGSLYNGFHSATKGLIDELMKRVNEESSAH
jgi:hypothetical protein